MVMYIEIIAIVLLAIFLDEEKFKKYGIPIIFISLILIGGLRNCLGLDDINYIEVYNNISAGNLSATRNMERIYIYISRFLSMLGFNYKALFLLYSSLTFFFIYIALKKLELKKNEYVLFLLSYLAFNFFPFLTTMRQALAMSIVFLAAVLCYKNKIIKSIILVIIAGFFHNSAWLTLPLILLFSTKIRIDKRIKILIPIACFIVSRTNIVFFIIEKINDILNLGYDTYILDIKETGFIKTGLLTTFMFLLYIIQCFINNITKFKTEINSITNNSQNIDDNKEKIFNQKIIVAYNKLIDYMKRWINLNDIIMDNEKDEFFEKGTLLFFTTFILTYQLGFIARFTYYFIIYENFILLNIISKLKECKSKKVIIAIAIILLVLLDIYIINTANLAGDLSFSNFSFNILGEII